MKWETGLVARVSICETEFFGLVHVPSSFRYLDEMQKLKPAEISNLVWWYCTRVGRNISDFY